MKNSILLLIRMNSLTAVMEKDTSNQLNWQIATGKKYKSTLQTMFRSIVSLNSRLQKRNHLYKYKEKNMSCGLKYFSEDMKPNKEEINTNYPCIEKERTSGATSAD